MTKAISFHLKFELFCKKKVNDLRARHEVKFRSDCPVAIWHVRPPNFGSGFVQFRWKVSNQLLTPLTLLWVKLHFFTFCQSVQFPLTDEINTIKSLLLTMFIRNYWIRNKLPIGQVVCKEFQIGLLWK